MVSQAFESSEPGVAAVVASHVSPTPGDAAIIGQSDGRGVLGISGPGQGVWGHSETEAGTVGVSTSGVGVHGASESNIGVLGRSTTGVGVHGVSFPSTGVRGESQAGFAVHGTSISNTAVLGTSTSGIGVHAATDSGEAAIRGDHHADGFAGFFNGSVGVTLDLNVNRNIGVLGDIRLVGADVAEDFEAVGDTELEPGCVMVLVGGDRIRLSERPYDTRVAGVISGAGGYRPGLILDRVAGDGRWPLALMGKVWCKVDADHGPIEVGDVLTTSPTRGHAMRAADPQRAFGAMLGKALGDLRAGRGLLPVLVALG